MKALSNFDINKYYIKNPYYGGCYSRDLLKKVPHSITSTQRIYVVNIDPSYSDNGGTHWIAVSTLNPQFGIIFDPFGVDPTEDCIDFVKNQCNRKYIYCNTNSVQDISSDSCGYFCLYVLDQLLLGKRFTEILSTFSTNRLDNEKMLKNYFKIK